MALENDSAGYLWAHLHDGSNRYTKKLEFKKKTIPKEMTER